MVERRAQAARRRRLSYDRIVATALELIDEQGIGVTSMRTVGERLGVRAMSLYRYVDNREGLFDAVVDMIVGELDRELDIAAEPVEGWRVYLQDLAYGVRRYAIAHPRAFPLVATRPPDAPWVNPPLRSLRWIEAMLATLRREAFTDDQLLFAYRSFNSFLLGFLLLETSGMVLRDPQPGDGTFQTGGSEETTSPDDPVPGPLSPTRSGEQQQGLTATETQDGLLTPGSGVAPDEYPAIFDLSEGLAAEYYETEFRTGLSTTLDRIATYLQE